ncbi:MAG: MFS transporter [Bergeyella sp.]|nr:MFS transporter [Bergeyella sp.]
MKIKYRLSVLWFLQFFVWGAWLITFGNYWFGTKQWDGSWFGIIFSTMGIASLFMPALTGMIADRWMNAERLYALLHVLYGGVLFFIPLVESPISFFWYMLLAMCFYMPTLSLSNSVSYTVLKKRNGDVVKDFPPIRVWGTVGFIAAMWITNLSGNKASAYQFTIAGVVAVICGLYALFLPECPPEKSEKGDKNLLELLGLDAFKLFSDKKILLFFVFSMFLGAALQLTNAYGDVFLGEFKNIPRYRDSFVVKRSTLIMSISQISETLFILSIPFFFKKFGVKLVMLMSISAWVLRFALFALGTPEGFGLVFIILSCIVYGMAFDFFNISGSIFIETYTSPKIRSSAQGLFMMMTNGFGSVLGSFSAGWLIDLFFTSYYTRAQDLARYMDTTVNNGYFVNVLKENFGVTILENGFLSRSVAIREWPYIWFVFSLYAFVIGILFALLFKDDLQESKKITSPHNI